MASFGRPHHMIWHPNDDDDDDDVSMDKFSKSVRSKSL